MLEWEQILKHMKQLFSPEYKWSVGGGIHHGKRLLAVTKDERSADMLINAEATQEDLYYAGHLLIDKLNKEVIDDGKTT